MPQDLKTKPSPENFFPNPWEYHGVPRDDMKDLMQLYRAAYLDNAQTLPRALEQFTYPPEHPFVSQHPLGYMTQSHEATQAAMFFLISDFIAMFYERRHPNFKMREIPKEVLGYLVPPYNRMSSLSYDDQKRFKATLPPEQQHLIYIDE